MESALFWVDGTGGLNTREVERHQGFTTVPKDITTDIGEAHGTGPFSLRDVSPC